MNHFDLNRLGTYNAEVSRGIVHTDEWKAAMAALQEQWNLECNPLSAETGERQRGSGGGA